MTLAPSPPDTGGRRRRAGCGPARRQRAVQVAGPERWPWLSLAGVRAWPVDLGCVRSAGVVVVREPDEVAALRRDLGRQLAGRRKAAGLVQREFGVLVGYSRTAVANAETGHAQIGRSLWERADRVLGTGELFARGFDRIQAQASVAARASATLRPASGGWSAEPATAPGGPRVADAGRGAAGVPGSGLARRGRPGWAAVAGYRDGDRCAGGAAGRRDGGAGLVAVHPGGAR